MVVGLVIGMAYWILEAILHSYVFHDGPLTTTLYCEHDPNEMWMRILITILLGTFGWVAERMVQSERRDKERVNKLNQLLAYVNQVCHAIGTGSRRASSPLLDGALDRIETTLLDEGEVGKIVNAMQELSHYVDTRIEGLHAVLKLTHEINKGVLVDEVLERMYETFRSIIPYDRIGVALLRDEGRVVMCRWARSDFGETKMPIGYMASMQGSSLQRIIETGEPRIINDLSGYLEQHPNSGSSSLVYQEGVRSSLTCPLIAAGKPIGFIFFSSRATDTYRDLHSDIFKLIAGQLSVVIEKGHMYEQLVREKEVSESLLLNVMPDRIITRIKAGVANPVEEIPEAGVLFADIVGFTEAAHHCSAEAIVQFLHDVFTRFDVLCEKHGLEKIKTIGDAYMVFTGRNDSPKAGVTSLVRFAQEALAAVSAMSYPDNRTLNVRIGIHVGKVVAGVIGQKKFAYDIWGETVNLAQRLESSGIPGRIHVSEHVQLILKGEYTFESRGEIELKGLGRVATYLMAEQ